MRTCILFGAGSEVSLGEKDGKTIGIGGGEDFTRAVLGIGYKNLNTVVKEFFDPRVQAHGDG